MNERFRSRVRCAHCRRFGWIILAPASYGEFEVNDQIKHARGCPRGPAEQPAHLRKRGWRAQEKRANELVGARATPASGALGEDGDGRVFLGWRGAAKQTHCLRYNLHPAIWEKLVRGALPVGEEPILHVQLRDRTRFVIIRSDRYGDTSGMSCISAARVTFNLNQSTKTPAVILLSPRAVVFRESQFKEWHDGRQCEPPPKT